MRDHEQDDADDPVDPEDPKDTGEPENTGAPEDAGASEGAEAEEDADAEDADENWDSLRLRLIDYGIGIAIAAVLTPLLVFGVLLAFSDTFRSWMFD